MNRILGLSILLLALLPGLVLAEKKTYTLTLQGGKTDHLNAPVSVPLTVPSKLAQGGSAWVRMGEMRLPAQVTAPGLLEPTVVPENKNEVAVRLHFIVPALRAGQTVTATAELTDTPFGADVTQFNWHDTKGEFIDLKFGDRPVLRYMYHALDDSTKEKREQTYKVFHHVFDPSGKRLVTKGPGGLYTHHRGLFFGFMKVTYDTNKVVDIWHCKEDTHQAHDKVLLEEAGPVLARQRVQISWHGKKKEVFARETRELVVYNVPGSTLIDFQSKVETLGGPIKVDGDPQHAGFHFRADNEVASRTAKQTIYIRPDGTGKPGETRNWPAQKNHVNLPWDGMSFVLSDQRYTVAYLDHPQNPKEARYSERDYGRFGSYFVATITEKTPLRIQYRVHLQEGQMKGSVIDQLRQDFVQPIEVSLKP